MDDFSDYMVSHDSSENVYFGNYWLDRQLAVKGVDIDVRDINFKAIIEETTFARINIFTQIVKKLIFKHDIDVKSGDLIKAKDKQYLITSEVSEVEYYKKARIQEVNNVLTTVYNNEIKKIPCIINNKTLYSDGLDERYQIEEKNDLASIWVATDEIVSSLKEGMYLIFKTGIRNYRKFKVTMIDDFTVQGVTMVNAKNYEITKNDNLELLIADYYKDDIPIIKPPSDKGFIIKGLETIYRNIPKQFVINDDKGIKATDKWTFTSDKPLVDIKVIDDAIVELSVKGAGTIVLNATNGTDIITKSIVCKMRL